MIKFEKAYSIIMESSYLLDTEEVDLEFALGRVLASDVLSDMHMPPFDKSAMDGYACKEADLRNELEVIEIIPAGYLPQKKIGKNQCSKIMTGAMLPDGADCVIMVEHTEIISENKIRYTRLSPEVSVCQVDTKINLNICYCGEDIKTGDLVLPKGTFIKPQHIAILASVGCVNPKVYRRPKIAVIPTGSELVEPHKKPSPTQIRNSNGAQLMAQIARVGAEGTYIGIAADTDDDTLRKIMQAVDNHDIIILSGGVSMGDYDLVPKILEQAGFQLFIESVAVQPGKPLVFGTKEKKFVFGMPGNPVSSFVQFELMTKPLIYRLMGFDYKPLSIKMPLHADYTRRKAQRMSWLPVRITPEGTVKPVEYHGSAHINAYSVADGIIAIPVGVQTLKKGELVDVRQI